MRIADILLRDEDGDGCHFQCGGGGLGCVGGADFLSPRQVIGRWLKRLREKKGTLGSGKIGKGKERVESGDGSVPTRCSTNWSSGGNELSSGFKESSDGSGPSGSCRKETSFNLGVGASLFYLIASSKNELNKMTELRTQMENLLGVSKERKDALSYAIPESEIILEYDQSSKRDSPIPEYSAEGMNQLEKELETELERLQLNLETETLLDLQKLEAGQVTEEHNGGVPPYVLERRLHELLESRQEVHIQELEAAVKSLQQKLQEKELELSWWKDTARLIP